MKVRKFKDSLKEFEWIRTPENIKELNKNDWKRFIVHLIRFRSAIRQKRYDQLSWIFKDIITVSHIL